MARFRSGSRTAEVSTRWRHHTLAPRSGREIALPRALFAGASSPSEKAVASLRLAGEEAYSRVLSSAAWAQGAQPADFLRHPFFLEETRFGRPATPASRPGPPRSCLRSEP